MKKIRVYTENHASEKYWLNHLVHPVRAFWGDGTDDWPKWEKDCRQIWKQYFIKEGFIYHFHQGLVESNYFQNIGVSA